MQEEMDMKAKAGILSLYSETKMDRDLVGLEDAKQAMREAVIIPLKFPQLSMHKKYKWQTGILMYGPKGGGKSILVKSIANEIKIPLVGVNAQNFLIKNHGVDIVKNTFEIVKEKRQGIILIENSELFGTKILNDTDSTCQTIEESKEKDQDNFKLKLISELLVQMQLGFMEDYKISVIYETSEPWLLANGDSLLRVGEKQILIASPSVEDRTEYIMKHLSKINHTLTDKEVDELSDLTKG